MTLPAQVLQVGNGPYRPDFNWQSWNWPTLAENTPLIPFSQNFTKNIVNTKITIWVGGSTNDLVRGFIIFQKANTPVLTLPWSSGYWQSPSINGAGPTPTPIGLPASDSNVNFGLGQVTPVIEGSTFPQVYDRGTLFFQGPDSSTWAVPGFDVNVEADSIMFQVTDGVIGPGPGGFESWALFGYYAEAGISLQL